MSGPVSARMSFRRIACELVLKTLLILAILAMTGPAAGPARDGSRASRL